MRIALFQPEIPQNTGTILRLGSCLGVGVDIIEPCGFGLNNHNLKRAGMDYVELANYLRHDSWNSFLDSTNRNGKRLVYLTPHAIKPYTEFCFGQDDILLMGRESDGIPAEITDKIDDHLMIPMYPDRRSLNVAVAAAMVLGEALRQTDQFYSAKL